MGADCQYYHLPSYTRNQGKPLPKKHPNQVRLAVSLECPASGYHRHLDDQKQMCQFDAQMSYRTCSQVHLGNNMCTQGCD